MIIRDFPNISSNFDDAFKLPRNQFVGIQYVNYAKTRQGKPKNDFLKNNKLKN